MNEKPRLVDLFGFVHEVKIEIPSYYFNQIGDFGANIKCPKCKIVTYYKAYNKIQYKAEPTDIIKYQFQHQCQTCANLKMAEINNYENSLENLCECGGQFRRDKPLLCCSCITMNELVYNND